MPENSPVMNIQSELAQAIALAKCRKCGCMKNTPDSLQVALPASTFEGVPGLLANIETWQQQMEPIQYACLGCHYCFPAVATNRLNQSLPEGTQGQPMSCAFEVKEQTWPPVPGEYFALCKGESCPVAVSTLGSAKLAEQLASLHPEALCIVGKTETEESIGNKTMNERRQNLAWHGWST